MSGWNPAHITAPGVGGTSPSDAWRDCKPECTKSPGRKPITPKHPTAKWLDYCGPTKSTKLENGTLFYLLPMNIINVIDDWLIGLEHYKTLNTIVAHIKQPHSLVLQIGKHKQWITYLYFGNVLIYQENKFHWSVSYYVKTPCGKHNND